MHVMDHLGVVGAGSLLGHHVAVEQQGAVRRVLRCHTCGHESVGREPFLSAQVAIQGCPTLEAALAATVAPELMTGREAIHCPACASKQDASLCRYFDRALEATHMR